ncbi:MAG: sulfite exporter TauE/SafE family protein [Polyangiaceae bacterium]
MDVAGVVVSLPAVALLGVVVGVVAGMFGVGGGFLLTPLLSIIFDIPMPIAVGTGLCQMIGIAIVALLRHKKLGQGEHRFDWLMFAGSALGAAAGSVAVSALERQGSVTFGSGEIPVVTLVLYGAYTVLLASCSWLFWRQGVQTIEALNDPQTRPLTRLRFGPLVDFDRAGIVGVSAIGVAYVGLALGFLSGVMGIGGGVALMPILIYGYGFPIKQAAGTGILALLLTVTVGTVSHALAGHVHLGLACVLLIGSTISAQLGAILTRKLPARTLRRVFAALLWFAVLAIIWDTLRDVL